MYNQIPNQRVPLSQKTPKWRKEMSEAYMGLADSGRTGRKEGLQRLYDYYNGVIHDLDYKYVLEPYGKKRHNFPSKLRNYPLIKPTIDLLLGEKSKRPLNYSVIALNDDVNDRRMQKKNETILKNMHQNFVNELSAMGIEHGGEQQEIPPPADMAKMFDRTYKDNRAVLGQRALTYIIQEQEVKDKFVKAWFHFLVAGEAFTHRRIGNNKSIYGVLNPLNVDYDMDPDLDYIEDGDWAMVTNFMHPSTVVEYWGKELGKDKIDQVMALSGSGNYGYTNYTQVNDHRENIRDRLVRVRTLYWKSLQRIGFLTYYDPETGAEEMEEVEDGFVLPKELKAGGAKLEWEWHNEVWRSIVIDDDIIVEIEPMNNQRASINSPSSGKLPINGRRYSDVNSSNISLTMLGIPFQVNKNVIKYRLETSIARSKDIIAQLDINLIPKKWDMDKFMYHIEGTGVAWVDYNKEGVRLSPNHQTVMDLSVKTISMYVELLNYIDAEWEYVSGVNRQRRGDISQYEGKATGQQAIVQSGHTTEDMFRKFAGLERRDLQGLIDNSKEAWVNGKNTMYVMPDGTQEFLSVDPDVWLDADVGVFVSDATRDVEKMNLARELAGSMAQAGAKTSTVLDILDEDNFVLMKGKIVEAEKIAEQLQQAQIKAEQEAVQAERAFEEKKHSDEMADNEKQRLADADSAQRDRDSKEHIARLNADQKAASDMHRNRPGPDLPEPKEDKGPELALRARDTKVKEDSQKETVRHNKATEKITREKSASSTSPSEPKK